MTYRINSIDERFGLSRQEVTDAVHEAVAMWEKAIGHKSSRKTLAAPSR